MDTMRAGRRWATSGVALLVAATILTCWRTASLSGTWPFTTSDVVTTIVLLAVPASALMAFYLLWLRRPANRWPMTAVSLIVVLAVANVGIATSARAGASSQSTTGLVLVIAGAVFVLVGASLSRRALGRVVPQIQPVDDEPQPRPTTIQQKSA